MVEMLVARGKNSETLLLHFVNDLSVPKRCADAALINQVRVSEKKSRNLDNVNIILYMQIRNFSFLTERADCRAHWLYGPRRAHSKRARRRTVTSIAKVKRIRSDYHFNNLFHEINQSINYVAGDACLRSTLRCQATRRGAPFARLNYRCATLRTRRQSQTHRWFVPTHQTN